MRAVNDYNIYTELSRYLFMPIVVLQRIMNSFLVLLKQW